VKHDDVSVRDITWPWRDAPRDHM